MQTVCQHQESGRWNNIKKELKNRQSYLPFTADLSSKWSAPKRWLVGEHIHKKANGVNANKRTNKKNKHTDRIRCYSNNTKIDSSHYKKTMIFKRGFFSR